MKCTKCGNEINEGAETCNHCGADLQGKPSQNGISLGKLLKYAFFAYLAYLFYGFLFGGSHKCVGKWEGSFLRPNDSSVRESWVVKINNDGSCEGSEVGSGSFNYEIDYTRGTWHAVSDDVIYVEMKSDGRLNRTTYSKVEADRELAKAQTPWAKHEAYKKTSGTKLQYSGHTTYFYLRSDGKISTFGDFSDPEGVLSKH